MTIYNLVMTSFYYDGDSNRLESSDVTTRSFRFKRDAHIAYKEAINEELVEGTYTEDMLDNDETQFRATFFDYCNGKFRPHYCIEINEDEID